MQNIIANKTAILKSWEDGIQGDHKYVKARRTLYADVNELVWNWFVNARVTNNPNSRERYLAECGTPSQELCSVKWVA